VTCALCEETRINFNQENCVSEINKIYEIVDRTDDEMYFTLGIFLSLEEAIINVE